MGRSEIIKMVAFDTESDWTNSTKGKGLIKIDKEHQTLSFETISGALPYWGDVYLFLLSDKDIRKMVLEYQRTKRHERYEIRQAVGMSGKEDWYINFFDEEGIQLRGRHLLHISCFGKVNKVPNMYIGDFVEMIYKMGVEIFPRQKMRRISSLRYVQYYRETGSASTMVHFLIETKKGK